MELGKEFTLLLVATATPDRTDSQDSLERASLLQRQRRARQMSSSLLEFVKGAWPIVEPNREFVSNWHIEELCLVLEDIAKGNTKRAIINVPPGTMKTLLVSVFFPCWLWARNSKLKILTASYSAPRAYDANVAGRKIIRSDWFQSYWPLKLKADQDEKGRFDSVAGGWRIATSVGGEGTGLHPNFILIDDASTAIDAQSDVERKTVTDWYSGTVTTRGAGIEAAIVVLGQRLHEEDLSGYLLNGPTADSYMHVCWPMRYERSRPASDQEPEGYTADPRDRRTQEGELLWPALFNEEKVKQLEIDLAEDAPGQLQQRPAAKGGRLFKIENFKFYDTPPAIMRLARGWDIGSTEGGGDWTVGVKIGEEIEQRVENGRKIAKPTGRFYVLDVAREQFGPEGVDSLMRSTAEVDGIEVAQREEVEGGSSGKAVIAARTKLLVGFDYEGVPKHVNKVIYSKPYRAQVNAGNVYLPRGAKWVPTYTNELRDFPTVKHDDQVDGSSTAFNAVLMEVPKPQVDCTW